MEVLSRPKAINKSAKPIKQSEKLWILNFLKYFKMKPKPNRGIAAASTLKEKPKRETIQAVTVVPIFAPKIIPMA